MSRYPRERLEARLHLFAIDGAHRVFGVARMPLQLHSSPSRFCDGKSGFAVMYASLSFETCIVETLVRDRFTHRLKRELPLAAVLARGYARISTQPDRELKLLDLRDTGCVDIGAPTDVVRARHFAAGQALGKPVYEEHADVDGFIYASRLTGDDCIAVLDRAVGKFRVVEACELKDHPELPAALERNGAFTPHLAIYFFRDISPVYVTFIAWIPYVIAFTISNAMLAGRNPKAALAYILFASMVTVGACALYLNLFGTHAALTPLGVAGCVTITLLAGVGICAAIWRSDTSDS